MIADVSALQRARASYEPKLPAVLQQAVRGGGGLTVTLGEPTAPPTDQEAIAALYPATYGQPVATLDAAPGGETPRPLRVGVVLSGGQAPGGHNAIAGLFDALKSFHPDSRLFGYLKGPIGVIRGKQRELTAEYIEPFRNTGGFSMIMSGRDKIETPEDLAACQANLEALRLDGLVVIGGDDSNTNAAALAEYLKAAGSPIVVVGVPKTIDGDMKNEQIEASFGFDTACKTYSELIGNIARDATSAVKYWHFIRLMGRSASHVTLECALQTHPNVCLVGEEIEARGMGLAAVVEQVVDVITSRAAKGLNYGILLVPEGIVEFMPDFKQLIAELKAFVHGREDDLAVMPDRADRVALTLHHLTAASAAVYTSLPDGTQDVLLTCDSHGNIPVSQIETERLLVDMVAARLAEAEEPVKFAALTHFFGYEGRCAPPSNFDSDYTYTLGATAAAFVRAGLTGYTVHVRNLLAPHADWAPGGTPVTMMLNMELRKGKQVPVIKKTLVDLHGEPLHAWREHAPLWADEDHYVFPGPIQYWGPPEVCDAPTLTLRLERS
jgi:pyrophosphate--fructose-6-phosphate 1-phosphotransferase